MCGIFWNFMNEPSGIEALVCGDIATRQRLGIAKYGRTVAESTDDMLQHLYEELLDASVYVRAELEKRREIQRLEKSTEDHPL